MRTLFQMIPAQTIPQPVVPMIVLTAAVLMTVPMIVRKAAVPMTVPAAQKIVSLTAVQKTAARKIPVSFPSWYF